MNCLPTYKGRKYQTLDLIRNIIKAELRAELETGVKREEQVNPEVNLTFSQKAYVSNNIAQIVMKKIGMSSTLTSGELDKLLDETFQEIVDQNQENFPGEMNELMGMKDQILGIRRFFNEDSSARGYISIYLGLNEKVTNQDAEEDSVGKEDGSVEGSESPVEVTDPEDKVRDFESSSSYGYDQSAYEIDMTKSLSKKVMMLLSGIQSTDVYNKTSMFERFMGLDSFVHPTTVLLALQEILANSSNDLASMRLKIDAKIAESPLFGFLDEVMNRIEAQPVLVQNQILNKLNSISNDMSFVMVKVNLNTGRIQSSVLDANSKSPNIRLAAEFNRNFKQSPIIHMGDGDQFRLNLKEAQKVLEELEDLSNQSQLDKENINSEHVSRVLRKVGLNIHPLTIDGFKNRPDSVSGLNYRDLYSPSTGAVGIIMRNLSNAIAATKEFESQGEKFFMSFDPYSSQTVALDSGEEVEVGNILTFDNNNFIKDLIGYELQNRLPQDASMYIDGLPVYAFSIPNLAKSLKNEIRQAVLAYHEDPSGETQGKLAELLGQSVNKSNFLLQSMMENPKAALAFDVETISSSSFKVQDSSGEYKKYDNNGKISDLGPKDYLSVMQGFFGQMGASVALEGKRGRIASMFFPALSDASDLYTLKSTVLDINTEDVAWDPETGNFDISPDIKDHMAENLVYNELNRIMGYMMNLYNNEKFSALNSDQNFSSMFFLGLPGINFEKGEDGTLLIDMVHATIKTFAEEMKNPKPGQELLTEQEQMQVLENKLRDFMYTPVSNFMNSLAHTEKEKFLKKDHETGLYVGEWVSKEIVESNPTGLTNKVIDTKFLESKAASRSIEEKVETAALDFAINSLVAQANIQNTFAGDLTNYAKEAGTFEKDADGHIDFFSLESSTIPENTESREKAMRTVVASMNKKLSDNRSKRLKALLSPSLKNANSVDQEYLQLFMQDIEGVSDYIESLIELHYPGELNQEEKDLISNTLRAQKEIESEESKIKPDQTKLKEFKAQVKLGQKFIKERFPKVKGFTEITGTDAQEYTTWREHLRTLMDRGMVEGNFDVQEVKEIYKKLNDYEKSDYKGTLELTEKEKDIIFQPLKPLHAGTYSDTGSADNPYKYGFVNSQFVYVKTSSFPLIPGITAGTKLDNIRKNLESLERLHGMPVRASYASGNKVGGTKVAASTHTLSGNVLDDTQLTALAKSSSKVLSRKYFGIQQDKSYKADKNLESGARNEITRAVQIERTLLSNGIATDEKKRFDLNELDVEYLKSIGIEVSSDGKISGKDLFTIINNLYSEEQDINREILYNKFNAKNQTWQDDVRTLEKLRGILIKEAKTSQAKKALDLMYLVEEENEEGDVLQREVSKEELDRDNLTAVSARFKVPVWLNNNSLSTESSLNAMVSKALARLKMPGWSSPVGSSNKFSLKEEGDLTKDEISDIVYLDSYKGGELRYDVDENGKLLYSQVLVSSRFEYNKEVGTDADGNPIYKKSYADLTSKEYSEVQGNRRVLKKENFDKDLLKALSFRTPYSDLGSGATIEIVGFLPRKMGDLMIVPREHTTQFGEDYDIDVRNVYAFNVESYKSESGTIAFRKLSPKKNSSFIKKNLVKIQEEYEAERELLEAEAEAMQGKYYMLDMNRVAEIKILRERKNVLKPLVKSGEITEQDLIDELDLINTTLAELDSEVAKSQYRENVQEINQMVSSALKELGSETSEKRAKALENVTKLRTYQQHRKKMIENDILKVYHAVYGSNDKDIRRSINKSLNTDLSEDTVDIMKKAAENNSVAQDTRFDTMYSTLEQQKIMESGHSGKLGIGVHSLWVTFTALAQHVENPINVSFGENNSEITFGNLVFKPTIGNKSTVSNQKEGFYKNVLRLITEVNMENQNVATDNQKLLVMGDRNENEYTINAFALLCNMGVDTDTLVDPEYAIKDEKGKITGYPQVHVPSLFLNQPILKRFVELKKQNSSLTNSRFMSDKDIYNKLFDELAGLSSKEDIEKYKSGQETVATETGDISIPVELDFKNLTPENLLRQATGGETNPIEQAQILHFFRELDIKAKEVSAHQGALKLGSNGIDRSSFRNIHIKEFLKKLGSGKEGSLEGITNMYGEFPEYAIQPGETVQEAMNRVRQAVPAGFILGDDYSEDLEAPVIRVFIPNNFAGAKLASVVQATTDILGNVFPYENPEIQALLEDVFSDTVLYKRAMANKDTFGALDMFSGKGLEFTYKIMAGLKNYLGTANFSDFFSGPVEEERKRLLYKERTTQDGEEVTLPSLPGYLNMLRSDPEYEWMFKQAFFRDIDPILNDLNTPDVLRLQLNNKNATEAQDINTFLSILYEMSDRKLPDFKGDTNYTPQKLVTDLARYSSLAGDSGGAMGFKNLIPFEVFEKTKYNEVLRMFENIMTGGEGTGTFGNTIKVATQGNMKALMSLIGPSKLSRAMRDSETGGASIKLEDLSVSALNKLENLVRKINRSTGKENLVVSGNTLLIASFSDTNLINNILKDQVLRHNPDMLVSVKESELLDAAENFEYLEGKEEEGIFGVSRITVDPGSLKALGLTESSDYFKVPIESGGVSIFRKIPGTDDYIQVDRLGMTGSQEYTFGSKHIDSGIAGNTAWRTEYEAEQEEIFDDSEEESPSTGGIIENKLENSVDLETSVLEVLAEDAPSMVIIREMNAMGVFSDGMGPITFVDDLVTPLGDSAGGVYIRKDMTINGVTYTAPRVILNRKVFSDPNVSEERKARILSEELIHKGTIDFIDSNVRTSITDKGKVEVRPLFDTIPESIQRMAAVKQAAFDVMVKSVMKDKNLTKSQALEMIMPLIRSYSTDIGRELTAEEKLLRAKLYRFTNMGEFVAGIITNKQFRTEMNKHKYKGKTILENVADLLVEMFNQVSKLTGKDVTVTEAGVSAFHEIITDIRESQVKTTGKSEGGGVKTTKVETWKGFWSRKDVENNPDKVFLFGDNFEDAETGYVPSSTQAVIRGLPNAIGISTKNNRRKDEGALDKDNYEESSYLDNEDLERFKKHVDEQIAKAIASGKTIVLPGDGIGTGAAQLEKRASKLFEYLNQKLEELKRSKTSENSNDLDDNSDEETLMSFNIFAEEDRSFLTERFLDELNREPFTRAMAKALEKVTKKC